MSKKIFLISLISISILIVGCSNKQTNPQESAKGSVHPSSATMNTAKSNTNDAVSSSNINNTSANINQQPDASNNYKKWDGSWSRGSEKVAGAYGLITISNSNSKQFDFSFYASYTTKIKGSDGKEYLNPHEGQIDGTAYFTSAGEAYYTNKDYPDYKMTFKLNDNNTITVNELNTKTNSDYGMSPSAGTNVRFSGDYTIKK